MMSDVREKWKSCLVGKTCWRMNDKKPALVPVNHQSLKGAVNCGAQLRAANRPLLCLLGKARIIEILKVILSRSFAQRGVAFKTRNISKKESEEEKSVVKRKEQSKTRRKAWEQEARKAKKAGKTKRHKKQEKKGN